MNELKLILLMMTPALVVGISMLDYAILGRWAKCNHCGQSPAGKNGFIVACVLEAFMFLAGLIAGGFLK